MRKLMLGMGALIVGVALAAPAQAATIDFAGGLGTISYVGGSAPLVGTNIDIFYLVAAGTTDDGVYGVTGSCTTFGCLNFTSGAFTSYSGGVYYFDGGGTISIVGGVPIMGIADGTTLLTGTFNAVQIGTNGSLLFFMTSIGSDYKSEDLMKYLGIPLGSTWTFEGVSNTIFGNPPTGGSFSLTAISTDIKNTSSVVPEPASLMLLGSGLFAVAFRARRRKTQSAT